MEEPRIIEVEPSVPVRRVLWACLKLGARYTAYPFRWLAGHITSVALRLYVHYCVQASSRAKCPACGVRAEHDVRWGETVNALLHVCKRCFAVWTEQPMVKAELWRTTLVAAEDSVGEATSNADGSRTGTVQHAQREPQIVTNVPATGKSLPVVVRFNQPGGHA